MPVVKPPFRLAVAAVFLDGEAREAGEILVLLQKDYAGEKICTLPTIEDSLQNLKAVGILIFSPDDSTGARYALSRHGRDKVLRALGERRTLHS